MDNITPFPGAPAPQPTDGDELDAYRFYLIGGGVVEDEGFLFFTNSCVGLGVSPGVFNCLVPWTQVVSVERLNRDEVVDNEDDQSLLNFIDPDDMPSA